MKEEKTKITSEDVDKIYSFINTIDPENTVFAESKELYKISREYKETGNLEEYKKIYKKDDDKKE